MVDTERMRRVLDRVRPGPPPPGPPPMPVPGPPPRPLPVFGPVEWLRQEERLAELLSRISRRSPALRRRMEPLREASQRRRRILRRMVRGSVPPPPGGRDGTVSAMLVRAEELAGGLAKAYESQAEREPRERRSFRELARSAGETERALRELLFRMK